LLYGSGLRLQECFSLRVKDLELERRVLVGTAFLIDPIRRDNRLDEFCRRRVGRTLRAS
jgi:integrase